jgi:hypothetical protein
MNDELERVLKKKDVCYLIDVDSRHLSGGTEEKHTMPQSK